MSMGYCSLHSGAQRGLDPLSKGVKGERRKWHSQYDSAFKRAFVFSHNQYSGPFKSFTLWGTEYILKDNLTLPALLTRDQFVILNKTMSKEMHFLQSHNGSRIGTVHWDSAPGVYHMLTQLRWADVSGVLPQPPSQEPPHSSFLQTSCERKQCGFQLLMGSLADEAETLTEHLCSQLLTEMQGFTVATRLFLIRLD